jgi:hypothetical protein
MRCRRVAAPSSLSLAGLALSGLLGLGATLVACFDLFHSTADVLTACELDNANTGCAEAGAATAAASPDSQGVDFCAWTSPEARVYAERACAWLGACETPTGGNAFGPCMFQALMAYDCTSNPNHRPKGKALALWECLVRVKVCGDVDACVFPAGPQACAAGGASTVCGSATDGGATNRDVRLLCPDGGGPSAVGENCALWGKTCANDGTGGACAGDTAGFACARPECDNSALHWCVDAGGTSVNVGLDCASNGAQQCDTFPSHATPQWAACVATSDAGPAGRCAPSTTATCLGGLAASCPSGVREVLDCATLLGSGAACSPGPLEPPFDWTSACNVVPPACTGDSCSDGILTGCARGAAFSIDCSDQGLGACRMVNTDTAVHAACSVP